MAVAFDDYRQAFACAERKALESGTDMAIRRVREYGRVRYVVSFACIADSDYARAEIVRPQTRRAG